MVRIAVWWCVGSTCDLRALIGCRILVIVPFLSSLGVPWSPAHPDIAANANTTALLSDSATQGSTFSQTRELLRTVDLQDLRLDLQAVCDVSLAWQRGTAGVLYLVVVFCAFKLLIQAETQAELALMSDRQVGENEVTSWVRAIQVDHTSNWSTRKYCGLVWVWHATRLCKVPGRLQGGEEEVIGVHREGDVFSDLLATCTSLELQHLELHNWWRVNRPAIGGC
jgi:hypothetical protein